MARQRLAETARKSAVRTRTRSTEDDAPQKRKRQKTDNPYGSDTAAVTDPAITALTNAFINITGVKDVPTADEAEKQISVIPMPALCLEYIFAQNGYPLSRIMHLFGVQHSGKSAMAVEIMRWHLEQQGVGMISETEGKDIPDLRNALLANPEFAKRVFFHQDPGTDLWQKRITNWLKTYEQAADGKRPSDDTTKRSAGIGRKLPFNCIVDSIGAASTEEERSKIDTAGFASRSHPVTALSISQFMKTLPGKLIDFPITLTFVNHQKPTQDASGRPDFSVAGGKSTRFHATYELEMQRAKSIKQTRSGAIEVAFRMRKNGLGEFDRRMKAQLVWYSRRGSSGLLQQYSYWDWYGATIDMLLEHSKQVASVRNEIKEIVDLQPVSGRRMYSRALGVSKDAPRRYTEVGAMLHARRDLVIELRKVLGIYPRPMFQPGIDMREQAKNFKKLKDVDMVCPAPVLDDAAADISDHLTTVKANTQVVDGRVSEIPEAADG